MQRFAVAILLAALVALTPAARAVAGIADSPLPVLVAGQTTLLLYSVPGVVNGGGMETIFSCTSTDTSTQTVGVECFGAGGGAPVNNATTSAFTLAAGATVNFATQAATFPYDVNLAPPALVSGSARILSTSKKLACTAFVADNGNLPPVSAWQLTVIAKTKQKAAN